MDSLPTVRARAALEGLALGDAFGDRLFMVDPFVKTLI
jgi:hypothetical protein